MGMSNVTLKPGRPERNAAGMCGYSEVAAGK